MKKKFRILEKTVDGAKRFYPQQRVFGVWFKYRFSIGSDRNRYFRTIEYAKEYIEWELEKEAEKKNKNYPVVHEYTPPSDLAK